MELSWHPYRYYPYERELALREINALLKPQRVAAEKHGVKLEGPIDSKAIDRLVYFSEASDGTSCVTTLQARLERTNGGNGARQATRYSSHGLHEYKGKFNPQIARAILNILHVPLGAKVIDPFCGSGTSLVECAHLGMKATGTDINPLAVFLANAKLAALRLPASLLHSEIDSAVTRYKQKGPAHNTTTDERFEYLQNWFDPNTLDTIERLKTVIEQGDQKCAPVLLTVASNLLRDYSLQDPKDLRIRRRKTPIPETPFIDAFAEAARNFVFKLGAAQAIFPKNPPQGKALLTDSRLIKLGMKGLGQSKFDCALTSPPYATALPYIDTQRLSLVWLDLIPPSDILRLEAQLVGSREVRGQSKKELLLHLLENHSTLPKEQAEYCYMLQDALSDKDGFRRQAVPLLLYRYFAGMAEVFKTVKDCMVDGAPFALIVGGNHTVLGGHRFDIDTPYHLAQIARSYGWSHEETITLQTYQRWGYHASNAVSTEGLIILRAQ